MISFVFGWIVKADDLLMCVTTILVSVVIGSKGRDAQNRASLSQNLSKSKILRSS